MSGSPTRKASKKSKGKIDLSPRERSILHLATLGYTDRAISAELGISKGTLGTYWNRLRMKVGSYNRTELVATVLRNDFDQELKQVLTDSGTEPTLEDDVMTDGGTHANVLLVDASGVVTGAGPTAAGLFGLSLSGIMGCRIETLVPDLLPVIQTELLRAQVKGHPIDNDNNIELVGRRQSGTEFPLAVILWPIATAAGWLVLCGLRNMELEITDASPHG